MQNQINLNIEKFVVTATNAIEGTNINPGAILEVIPADLSKPLNGVYFLKLSGFNNYQDVFKVSKIKGTNKRFYCTANNEGNTLIITPSDIQEAYLATKIISSPVI